MTCVTPFRLAAFIIAFLPLSASAQTYRLTDLGATYNGPSNAMDISANGKVSGGTGDGACALWLPNATGGMTYKSLGRASNSDNTYGYGVNDAGQVAATAFAFPTIGVWECGFFWNGSQWKGLTNKTVQSEAMAVNDYGGVVGAAAASQGVFYPSLWQGGKQYSLPVPANSYGLAINSTGQITGYYGDGPSAFVWTPAKANGTTGSWTRLPLATGRGYGVNKAGDVVGDTYSWSVGTGQAFLWDHTTGTVKMLGTLQPDPLNPEQFLGNSTARKINASGQVVGNSQVRGGQVHAFIWDSVNGMRDLNDTTRVSITGIPSGQTWVFDCPSTNAFMIQGVPQISINDAGQICGTGSVTINGVTRRRAFLLTPQ